MPLNQTDLGQIRGVVREEVNKRVSRSEKILKDYVGGKVDEGVNNLAVMTKNEFDLVHKKLTDHDKQFEFLKKAQLTHDFNESEMVIKPDYYRLEERVEKIEHKIGLKK